MDQELITIGQITTTHGHLGEVRVYPLTDFSKRFECLQHVGCRIDDLVSWLTISSVRYHKGFIILGFKEITDMNQAEKLKGGYLQIKAEDLMPLPEEHYYIFQLIGLAVLSTEGEFLGFISKIQQTGSNDVYFVQNPKTGKEILIPAIKEIVKEINLTEGKVTVQLLPGLID